MWLSENQRLGFRQCAPWGYVFHVGAGWITFAGIVSAVPMAGLIGYQSIVATFSLRLLWLLVMPIALIFAGWVGNSIAWSLAARKGFEYDYEKDTCTWNGA